jgi:hypothetical protein
VGNILYTHGGIYEVKSIKLSRGGLNSNCDLKLGKIVVFQLSPVSVFRCSGTTYIEAKKLL